MNPIQSKDIFNKLSGRSIKIACVILLFILMFCYETQTIKTGPVSITDATTPIPVITRSPAATLDPKTTLRESIIQVLSTGNKKFSRLTKISYSDPEAGDITITWAINNNVLQSTKADAQIDITNILKALENSKTRFIYVILKGTILIKDKYGKAAEIQAISLGFNKSKLDKINWKYFQPSDIYNVADVANIADEWK